LKRERESWSKDSKIQQELLLSHCLPECINKMEEARNEKSDEIKEGYTIEKKYLMHAWVLWRNCKERNRKAGGGKGYVSKRSK
jgi:hypothetical protein